MAIKFTNNASATLASSITNVATSIAVTAGQGGLFPALSGSDYFYATLVDSSNNLEIVKVTARTTDTLTVVRAQGGTSARAYTAGDKLELRVVAASLEELVSQSTPASTSVAGIVQLNNTTSSTSTTQAATANAVKTAYDLANTANTTASAAMPLAGGVFTGAVSFSGSSSVILRSPGDLDTTGTMFMSFQDNSSGSWLERAWVGFGEGNGNFRINSAVSGKNIIFNQAGGTLTIDSSGNATASGNVTAYSDERLKRNWADLQPGFVDALAQVKMGTYERIDSDIKQVGVSAQSLQTVLPDAIHEDMEGMLSVAYGQAALASAVALAREVVELKRRLEVLEAK